MATRRRRADPTRFAPPVQRRPDKRLRKSQYADVEAVGAVGAALLVLALLYLAAKRLSGGMF